jgi:hypothetical protein
MRAVVCTDARGDDGAPQFIPADANIVVGAVAPVSPDRIPIVLLPDFEHRMCEWWHPDTHEIHWLLERGRSAHSGEDDA